MTQEPLHAGAARHRGDPQFAAARNVQIRPYAGRGAPRTHPRHQPIESTVDGSVRAKYRVLQANPMPCVGGRRPTRFRFTR